jgi:hypothetical protein
VTDAKRGTPREGAPLQNFRPDSSRNNPQIAPSTPPARPRYVITFTPARGVDAICSLRLPLKAAKRRFGLVAIDAYEDRPAPLQISNQVADEFRELRDEVVAERAQAWRKP